MDLLSVDSYDLINLSFVYLGACETGKGGTDATNLVNTFYSRGVDCVLGFKVEVLISETNFWPEIFMNNIANGHTVYASLVDADYEILNDPILGGKDSYTIGESNRLIRGSTSFVPAH